MQGNFRKIESRGLSSVWNPGTHDPQPSSDAPTQPESVREPNQSFIPPPSLDIPDFRAAPRFHTQRKQQFKQRSRIRDIEEPSALENDPLHELRELNLGPEKTLVVEEIYTVLRSAGLEVPSSVLAPMSADEVNAAVALFFRFISPLPETYTADVHGTSELMRLLGYNESQLEIDMIALRMSPRRKSTWPLIVDLLAWLLQLTSECRNTSVPPDDQGEDWLANLEEDDMMGFENYFEFAQANAYLLLEDKDILSVDSDAPHSGDTTAVIRPDVATIDIDGVVTEEYLAEIRGTLTKYRALTEQATVDAEAAIAQCKVRSDELNREMSSASQTTQRVEQLRSELSNIESLITDLKRQIDVKQQEVSARQSEADERQALAGETQLQLEQLRSQFVGDEETTLEQAVAAAQTYSDLQSRSTALKERLQNLKNTSIEEYERPARQQLTAIRLGIEDYNTGTESRLQITSQLPHSLNEVWGRSLQSLLSGTGDTDSSPQLDKLKSEWEQLKAEERKAFIALEDDVAEMEAEITRMRSDLSGKSETEGLQRAVNQLENELTMINESVANIEHQSMRRKERADHCKLMLMALQKSMESLELQRGRLQGKRDELAPQMKQCIEDKQRYERLLLEYQNAYALLHDKIEQFERAKAGLLQTKLDSERWVRDLKPTTLSAVSGDRKRARALMEAAD